MFLDIDYSLCSFIKRLFDTVWLTWLNDHQAMKILHNT